MFFAEYWNAIIFCQTVRVEPVGADQFLRRQHSRQNSDRNADGCQNVFILRVLELKLDRVRSWLTASFRFDIEPEGLPLPRLHPQRRQRIIPLLLPQKVRI